MAKKKHKGANSSHRKFMKPLPSWAIFELDKATIAIERERWSEARRVLETLDTRCPRRPEVLALLAIACEEEGDARRVLTICRQMCDITPGDADAMAMAVHSYYQNNYPILALHTLDQLLALHPDYKANEELRLARDEVYAAAQIFAEGAGLSLDDMESAIPHEELTLLIDEGQYKDAQKVAHRLLERLPNFAPALNNLSQLLWVDNQPDKAIAATERVLEGAPDNVHALSNLVRYCFLSGREADARKWAAQLIASQAQGFDVTYKKAEALAYLGEDEALVAIYKESVSRKRQQSPGADAATAHLAAVAAWRLGREAEAKRWWKKWQDDEDNPLYDELQGSLLDLKKPVSERNGPWQLPFRNWINNTTVRDLFQKLKAQDCFSRTPQRGAEASTRVVHKFLADNPAMHSLLAAIIDRGSPEAREFALMLCNLGRTPQCLEALRDFALGKRGSDAMRLLAAHVAFREGALATREWGQVKLWQEGEWSEMLFLGCEIHDDADLRFSKADQKLAERAHDLVQNGDYPEAESLLRTLLKSNPGDPSVRYNLAQVLTFQEQEHESDNLLQELHNDSPDYLHARVAVARLAIEAGDVERAESLLQPLFKAQRLHSSEFALWAVAQVELLLAKGNVDAAQSWMDIFEEIMPEHPALAHLDNVMMLAALKSFKKL